MQPKLTAAGAAQEIEDIYTLSPMQQGILFELLSRNDPGLYLEQGACSLQGPLDTTSFIKAWEQAVARHPALRTGFAWEGVSKPVQIAYRAAALAVEHHDWQALSPADQAARLQDYLQADQRRGVDLTRPPLMRLAIIRLGPESHRFIWTIHHMVHDAWSTFIVFKEVMFLYEALSQEKPYRLSPAPLYRDYIAWLKRQDLSAAENFWRSYLRGFNAPTPPPGLHPAEESAGPADQFKWQELRLSTAQTEALNSFARHHRLTLNTLVIGAWALQLMHHSHRDEVMFGATVSGRPAALAGVDSMVGLFINTLPARVQLVRADRLSDWLQKLQEEQAQLRAYEYTPLRQIQAWGALPPGRPLFETILVFQNAFTNISGRSFGPLTISDVRSEGHSTFPLTLRVTPGPTLWVEILYSSQRFADQSVTRLLKQFANLLDCLPAYSERRADELLRALDEQAQQEKAAELRAHRSQMAVRLGRAKPTPVRISPADLVQTDCLRTDSLLPLLIQPKVSGLDLAAWAKGNARLIEQQLLKHGGLLLRGFEAFSISDFEQFMRALCPQLLEYRERSTPRTELGGGIYTSTEYPAHQQIALHNEFSYAYTWPMKIGFLCVTAAAQGGETPIADSRRVWQLLPPNLRERFVEKQVMYVRNYGGGIDLSWQEAFQTDDPAEVEAYCRRAPLDFEWRSNNRLRTRQVRPAAAKHPVTGELVWFNQAHLFHLSNLEPAVRESMLESFAEAELPRNAYYGDGTPLEAAALDEIRAAYQQAAICFPWQTGDTLLLENMLVAHGRRPYTGQRKIAVAMAEPFTLKAH
jgi:alpha-ketoglutarate-dependent taurine dioxygenase